VRRPSMKRWGTSSKISGSRRGKKSNYFRK
jgi:hypothetical protein